MQIKYSQPARPVLPDSFELNKHYYEKVINAQAHTLVAYFMNLTKEQVVERYCHLNPLIDAEYLMSLIEYQPKYIYWSGTDLFHVTSASGYKRMIVVETNSCPSGQKSMPVLNDYQEMGGYRRLLESSFLPLVNSRRLPKGELAVVYDKNQMEASGYAAALAEITGERVFLVSFFNGDEDPAVRFIDGIMEVRDPEGSWHPIRAALRYVTQKPWNRIPVNTKTFIYNPIVACLAGGRNKLVAAKAYDFFNAELQDYGLKIFTPETIMDLTLNEIPLWVKRFGGHAVIKVPYSNAGQGVYTITNERELQEFMNTEHHYNNFIVQSLVGNYEWSTSSSEGKYYHVGTVPNKRKEIYASDLRMMIVSSQDGYKPIAMYARRAKSPLNQKLDKGRDSWDMLGTNLSIKLEDGWDSDVRRLKLMDRKDFNKLGLSLDNLIDGFIQSVLSAIALDKMASHLINSKKELKKRLFASINPDPVLLKEIMKT
ncbi:MAG TPA: hypothetical protein GXZ20_00290 [Halanaerobiaceae bacterium]|jgi:hypothetical protein|nr:hypothetical protein [Bacillota bacterium]HHU91559.1 hypothetical protein [Halanaerobiaceae bacterium]HOA41225.1 hypothetical protein [Halanaerobiales bacterium]HPZ63625.1 hypothetical protein [Halanaerobiales bacterium]